MAKVSRPLNCETCPLNGQVRVPGEGPDEAQLVIVGECAGAQELRVGRPFVGPSGELLNNVLNQAGVNRSECYITNTVCCMEYPPRTPKAKEIACCRERMLDEVKSHKPKVVLALGKIAMKALLGINRPIGDERGAIHYAEHIGAFVIPTYHPAGVLRNPRLHSDLLNDVRKAQYMITQPNVSLQPQIAVDYTVVDTFDKLQQVIERYREPGPLSYDVETASDGRLLCLGVSCEPGVAVVITDDVLYREDAVQLTNEWLNGNKNRIAHNGKFDRQVLWRNDFRGLSTGEDTMLMSYVLNPVVGGHGLKQLVREQLDFHEDYAAVMRPYLKKGFEHSLPSERHRYNAHDAALTLLLANKLREQLDANDKRVLEKLLYPATDVLAEMEYLGIMVDIPYLTELDGKLFIEIEDLTSQLHEVAGMEFNPNSVPQLLNVMYKKLDLPIPTRLSTDKEALNILIKFTDHPFPKLLQQYRERKKFHSTYVRALLEHADTNDRVRTNYNLSSTVTGRLSSSKPMNLQNQPRTAEARNAFIATPGYTLVTCDLAQAEVRCWAYLSRDENLKQAIMSSDVHVSTASLMFGIRSEEVTKAQRQAAKHLCFGIIYQMTPQGLAVDLGVSVVEAQELQRKFFSAYPKGYAWIMEIQKQLMRDLVYETMFGRKLRFTLTTKNKAEVLRQMVNHPIQNLASDITLDALIRIGKKIRAGEYGDTRLLLTSHDDILLETKENPLEIARMTKWEMEQPVGDGWMPFVADAKIGQKWGGMKDVKI